MSKDIKTVNRMPSMLSLQVLWQCGCTRPSMLPGQPKMILSIRTLHILTTRVSTADRSDYKDTMVQALARQQGKGDARHFRHTSPFSKTPNLWNQDIRKQIREREITRIIHYGPAPCREC